MPFLATMPITMIRPMNEEMLNVVPVTSSARNTPEVESSADADHGDRRGEGAELEEQHDEDQDHRQHQHHDEVAERALLLLILPAVLHTDGRRQVQLGDALAAPRRFRSPRFTPSRRAVTVTSRCRFSRRISVCPGRSTTVASEPSVAVLPVRADQQRVPNRIERRRAPAPGSERESV